MSVKVRSNGMTINRRRIPCDRSAKQGMLLHSRTGTVPERLRGPAFPTCTGRSRAYTGIVLTAANPADLPVLQSTELGIWLLMSRPPGRSASKSRRTLLARADEVIESMRAPRDSSPCSAARRRGHCQRAPT